MSGLNLKPIEEYSAEEFTRVKMDAYDEGYSRKDVAEALGISFHAYRHAVSRANKGKKPVEGGEDLSPKSFPTSKNVMEVSSPSPSSVDDLLKHFGIDKDEWVITRIVANTWDAYRKGDKRKIVWEDRRIVSGYLEDDGDIYTKPLYQLKVTLVRKEPIAVRPVVSPVHIKIFPIEISNRGPVREHEKILHLPDTHFGFRRNPRTGKLYPLHDRQALGLCLKVAEILQPDKIVWLGDIFDFAEMSKFVSSPDLKGLVQPAVFECAWWLSQFRSRVPEQVILEGNHDVRMQKDMFTHVSYAFDLRAVKDMVVDSYPVLSVPNLLGLDEMGIEWIGGYPNNRYWVNDRLVCEHGSIARTPLGATAAAVIKERSYSTIFGHIHRSELATKEVKDRNSTELVQAVSCGFLGRLGGILPGNTHTQNWNQGFAVSSHIGNETPHIQSYLIDKGVAWLGGERIVADDYSEAIEKEGQEQEIGFF